MNTEAVNLKTYAKVATEYARRRKDSQFWIKEYQIFKKLLKGKKILDVGCGTGHEASYFLKDEFDYFGIDLSPAMLKEAKKAFPKAKFRVMNMMRLHFPKKTFDGIWA